METGRTSSGKLCKKCLKKGSPCSQHQGRHSPRKISPSAKSGVPTPQLLNKLARMTPLELRTYLNSIVTTEQYLRQLLHHIVSGAYKQHEKLVSVVLEKWDYDPESLSDLFREASVSDARILILHDAVPDEIAVKFAIERDDVKKADYLLQFIDIELDEDDWEDVLKNGTSEMAKVLMEHNVNMNNISRETILSSLAEAENRKKVAEVLLARKGM